MYEAAILAGQTVVQATFLWCSDHSLSSVRHIVVPLKKMFRALFLCVPWFEQAAQNYNLIIEINK